MGSGGGRTSDGLQVRLAEIPRVPDPTPVSLRLQRDETRPRTTDRPPLKTVERHKSL